MVSGYKKSSNKNSGVAFAKDKKQAIMAVVIMIFFFGSLINLGIKNYKEQHPDTTTSPDALTSQSTQPVTDANSAAIPTDPSLQSEQSAQPSLGTDNLTLPEQNTVTQQDANNIYSQAVNLQNNQSEPAVKSTLLPGEEIEIIPKKASSSKRINTKKVTIVVDNSVRSNPFLPVGGETVIAKKANAYILPYLTAPPEILPVNADAEKVMTTTISGILYDKYSPSAIINIEGSDYLVKKGDVINKYKILSIGKTQVLVQLGKNIYCAGVGELLTQTNINYNTIANLNKKFGGNDIPIGIRKKDY